MTPNILIILVAALIPFIIALGWFHKSLFGGKKWHAIAELSPEKAASPVKPFRILLSLLLNVFISFGTYLLTIHESGVFGMVGGDSRLMNTGTSAAFIAEYGGRYHTAATILFALPLIGYVVIFEMKSAKYFWVYLGYWWISLTLMSIIHSLWSASPA